MLPPCATDGCRSRSSRLSNSATSTITNNLSESSVADRRLADLGIDVDLDDLLLCYGDHLGDPALREAIAAGGDGVVAGDVLVTPGAAAALFCTATSLLEPGDHVVVVRTNYATNLETPRAIGADVDVVDLDFDDGWQLDVEQLTSRRAARHDPVDQRHLPAQPDGHDARHRDTAGARRARRTVGCGAARRRDLPRPHARRRPSRPAASLSTRAISVSSMSKAYGLPGLRVGWAVCRDPRWRETLLAAKEQMVICGATLDEAIACQGARGT